MAPDKAHRARISCRITDAETGRMDQFEIRETHCSTLRPTYQGARLNVPLKAPTKARGFCGARNGINDVFWAGNRMACRTVFAAPFQLFAKSH